MSRLTDQQRCAVEVTEVSVSLSSGAGCGKTTVLTEKFLSVVADVERGLETIVALTFTEKAARELRGRVRAASRQQLDRAGDQAARWRQILRDLEAVPIGTFHSFCQGLLRRFPIEAGVEPEFGILEESLAPSVRRRALDGQIRDWLAEGHPDLIPLAVEYRLDQIRSLLDDLIRGRGPEELARWARASEEEVLEAWQARWEREGRPALLHGFVDQARELLELLAAHACSHPKMTERRAYLLRELPTLPDDPDPVAKLAELREQARVQGGGKASDWPTPEIYERIKKLLGKLRDETKEAEADLTPDPEASRVAAKLGLRFARLAYQAHLAYDQAKQAEGLLDFDDLLLKTRDLLEREAATVRARMERSAELILVDEFQDTDPVQARILELLAGERFADGRLFLVGDSKQSIYRFRGAEPEIFRHYRERFPLPGRRDLTENFRSLPGILDFVNALFHGTFDDRPLEPGRGAPARDSLARVSFVWAEDPERLEEPNADTRRRTEAQWLARLIAGRIASGRTVFDRRTRAFRPMRAGDVAILFRTLNDAEAYESALVAAGLDYHVVGGSAFFAQQEIIDVINLLSTIDDPLDALALAATLRGPVFCVSDEGLYWLAARRGEGASGDLVASFERAGTITELSSSDQERIDRARSLLQGWRACRDHRPLADLLDRALAESGYEAALMAEQLGPRKRANVRKLVALARRFDTHGGWTLSDLVARLREDLRNPPREDQAATTEEEGDSVRLMTIHQAKGLEFPVVVLPDLNRDSGNDRDSVAFHPEMGVIVRPSSDKDPDPDAERGTAPNLGWTTHRHIEALAQRREDLRLFYVATTRAESDLILSSGYCPAEQTPKSAALQLLARRFDLQSGAVREPLTDPVPAIEVVPTEPPTGDQPASDHPHRPDPLELASLIEQAPIRVERSEPSRPMPNLVDLDPAAGLSPTAARLDRLLRAMLADPRVFDRELLPEIAEFWGLRQIPAASRALRDQAVARVGVWIERDPELTRVLSRSSGIERAVRWSLTWPVAGDRPAVIQGVTDFLFRRHKGEWGVLLVSDPQTPEPAEQLRLRLSALAAQRMGRGPVTRGRIVRLGDENREVIEEIAFGSEAAERALSCWLETISVGQSL